MIKLYGTHCPKCNVIEKKLNNKGIKFELIDDIDKVSEFGNEHGFNTAPLVELDDGIILDFPAINKYLNTLGNSFGD